MYSVDLDRVWKKEDRKAELYCTKAHVDQKVSQSVRKLSQTEVCYLKCISVQSPRDVSFGRQSRTTNM
jgi:hypothetical protein